MDCLDSPDFVWVKPQVSALRLNPRAGALASAATWRGSKLPVIARKEDAQGAVWVAVGLWLPEDAVVPVAPDNLCPPCPECEPCEDCEDCPDPCPEVDYVFEVTADKSLARFIYDYNAKGKPIFMIFPSEVAPPEERIKFLTGALVEVLPEVIVGDGGVEVYKMVAKADDGTELYLLKSEGILIGG